MEMIKTPAEYAAMLLRWAYFEKLVAVDAALKSREQYPGMTERYVAEVIHHITA